MKQALLSLVCSLGLLVGTAVAEPIGGVVYGSGTVDNDTTTHSIGPYFNFATGMSQLELDTTGAHIQVDTNEGGGFQPVRWTATDTVGFYRRIGLATSGSLDSITSVPAYDGTNYATYTSDLILGTGNLPMAVGELWAVYSRHTYAVLKVTAASGPPTGIVSLSFDYKWQPNGSTEFGAPPPPANVPVYGEGIVDNKPNTPYGRWFSFVDGTSMDADTTDAHICVDNKYGPSLKQVNLAPDIGRYRLIGTGTLDTVTSVPAYDGSNYFLQTYSSDAGNVNAWLPVVPGQLWAVYSRGTYAVVEITDTTGVLGDTVSVSFRYLWQPDGSTNFGGERIAPMQVKWINPHRGQWNVPQNADIVVQFDRDINSSSFWDGHGELRFSVTGDASGPLGITWWIGSGYAEEGGVSQLHIGLNTWPQLGEKVNIWVSRNLESKNDQPPKNLYRDFIAGYHVSEEAAPFTIISTFPANGDTAAPQLEYPKVCFNRSPLLDSLNNRNVIVAGDSGGGRIIPLREVRIYGNEAKLALSTYPALGEHITITLKTGIVADYDYTHLAADYTFSYTVTHVVTPTRVVGSWPDQYTPVESISRYSDVQVWFDPWIDTTTVDTNSVVLTSLASGRISGVWFSFDEGTRQITIHHPPFIPSDSITVSLSSAIIGVHGEPLEAYVFSFKVREFEPIRVRIPNAMFKSGISFAMPVEVLDDVTGKGIYSFQFYVGYDTNTLRLDSVSIVGTITEASWPDVQVEASDTLGNILVGAASSEPLVGSGALVYLHFTHLLQGSNWVFLPLYHHDGTFFNEGTPPVELGGGNISFVQMGPVHGHASYYGSGVPVDSVLVFLSNSSDYFDSTFTDVNGYYAFADVPAGNYSLWAVGAKRGGRANAITPMDASYILQNVVRTRWFDEVQQTVGDVTANGLVSAFDAAQVLRFVVGSITDFARPRWLSDAMWVPEYGGARGFYFDGTDHTEDIVAVLTGDVTLNWGQPPAKIAAGAPRVVSLATERRAGMWQMRLAAGEPVYAAEVTMTTDAPVDVAEVTAAEGWQVAWRSDGTTLRIALAGATPISDPADLMLIRVNNSVTPRFESVSVALNDGAIRAEVEINRPRSLALYPAAPNPFNPTTQLSYELPGDVAVRLSIVNALGQTVRVLVDEPQSAGLHRVTWNGLDDQGRSVASGMYVVTLRAGERVLHQRVMLVK